MGLFDRLKNIFKRNKTKELNPGKEEESDIQFYSGTLTDKYGNKSTYTSHTEKNKNFDCTITKKQGYTVIEYHNKDNSFRNFDLPNTRLIIKEEPEQINGKNIYNAQVSWYGNSDEVFISNGKPISKSTDYTSIKLGIDLGKILDDSNYKQQIMTQLVQQDRVKNYINLGLKDERECGNYIGEIGISPEDGSYRKEFDAIIGQQVHYSPQQITARQIFRQKREQQILSERAKLEADIAQKQDELNKLR